MLAGIPFWLPLGHALVLLQMDLKPMFFGPVRSNPGGQFVLA